MLPQWSNSVVCTRGHAHNMCSWALWVATCPLWSIELAMQSDSVSDWSFLSWCYLLAGGDECTEEDAGGFTERPTEVGWHAAAAWTRTGACFDTRYAAAARWELMLCDGLLQLSLNPLMFHSPCRAVCSLLSAWRWNGDTFFCPEPTLS